MKRRSVAGRRPQRGQDQFGILPATAGLALLILGSFTIASLPGTHHPSPSSPPAVLQGLAARTAGAVSPSTSQYTVTFDEIGLASSVVWGMSVYETGTSFNVQWDAYGNSTSTTLSNGSYYYTANIYSGGNYSGNNSDGSFDVDGHGLTITMYFYLLEPVEFFETGAPSGTTWAVETGGSPHFSTNSTLTFNVDNDTMTPYSVDPPPGYVATPANGTLDPNGSAVHVNLSFSKNTVGPWYPVWFNESGLPPNISWSVTVETQTVNTTNGSVEFSLVNGTNYPYSVAVPNGFLTLAPTGVVSVYGRQATILTTFTYEVGTYTFPHWFNSSGIAPSAAWKVRLVEWQSNASPAPTSVSTSSIEFELPSGSNGTYEVTAPTGYLASPRQGSYSVPEVGGGSTTVINFTSNPNPLTVSSVLATPNSVRLGGFFVLTTNITGAKDGVAFRYEGLPAPCLTSNTSALNCTPGTVGTFEIEAIVTDGAGEVAFGNATVVVMNATGASTTGNGSSGFPEWGLIGATLAGIGAILVVTFLVIRRRRT